MAMVSLAVHRRTALAAGVFLVAGAVMLAGLAVLRFGQLTKRATYYAEFSYVGGLETGAEVQVHGYPIGTVIAITPVIAYPDPRFRVELSIDPAWQIPLETTAVIASASLIGAPIVDIRLGAETLAGFLAPGDDIATAQDVPIAEQAETVLDQVQRFFSEDLQRPVANLQKLLDNLDARIASLFTDQLDPASARLRMAAENLDRLFATGTDGTAPPEQGTVASVLAGLEEAVQQAVTALDTAGESIENLNGFLAQVATDDNAAALGEVLVNAERALQQVERATASANRLVREVSPNLATAATDAQFSMQVLSQSLASVLQDLDRAAGDLAGLARDLRRNPGIIFGR